jgi:hypothetical protein
MDPQVQLGIVFLVFLVIVGVISLGALLLIKD